jgi:radical SAM superfamily enzyme YgiQ (UPF0313 family)
MILLTHGYFIAEDDKEQQIMKPYPPLGLLYISAYLKVHAYENTIFDSTFSSKTKLKAFLLENRPKIVAFYVNIVTKLNVLSLISFIKNDLTLKHTKIILGGPDLTYNVENYLNNGADFLVIGEGEQTMLELVSYLIKNKTTEIKNDVVNHIKIEKLNNINGIAFRENDKIIQTPARQKLKDLSELPLPNRAGIDLQKYLDVWKSRHGKNTISVSTQRGCPYTCKWCSTAVYGQSYRRRPAKKVVEELQLLKQNYNPDSIWFVDDVFSVNHKWIREFHSEVIKQKVVIPFECITRAERLNDDILKRLKEAGCFRIWIGAESGSQRIINKMDRRVDVNVVREIIQKTNKIGIDTGTFIMIGYPTETETDIYETIHHLKVSNPTQFTITLAYPIKGTALYDETETAFTKPLKWHNSTDRDIDFKRKYKRKYYDYAIRKIVNEVNYYKETLKGKKRNFTKLAKLKTKSVIATIGMKLYK